MKTQFIYFLLIPVLFITCANEEETAKLSSVETAILSSDSRIKLVSTIYGGCNSQSEEVKGFDESLFKKTNFSVSNDTLSAYISIDYICCTPFNTKFKIVKDSLHFIIKDSCKDPFNSCYCRCECKYTFDFKLINYDIKEYDYKIVLINPQEKEPIIIKSGTLDLKELQNY